MHKNDAMHPLRARLLNIQKIARLNACSGPRGVIRFDRGTHHLVDSRPPATRPKMNPMGWPAPKEANAMFFMRPPGRVAPRIPAPAGHRIAGAIPRAAIRKMKESDVGAKDTASEPMAKSVVPNMNSVLRPSVSARPPKTSRNTALVSLGE